MVTRKDYVELAKLIAVLDDMLHFNKQLSIADYHDTIDSAMKSLNPNYDPDKFWSAVRSHQQ